MQEIRVSIASIEDQKRLCLHFAYDESVINLIKTLEGRKWSVSEKYWHIPYFENYLDFLNEKFEGKIIFRDKEKHAEVNLMPDEYLNTLKLKNYSSATIKTYLAHFQRFLDYYRPTPPTEITSEQIRNYLLYLIDEKHYSTSAQNQAINAVNPVGL